jgi:hypothetical protein
MVGVQLTFAAGPQPAADTAPSSAPDYFHRAYAGTIAGKYPIRMELKKSGAVLTGTYQYERQARHLNLSGTVDSAGNFTMNEYVDITYSKPNAVFTGTLAANGIQGVWRTMDGSRSARFEARMTSEVRLEPKKEALREAVGTYPLESIGGAVGANALFDLARENGAWTFKGTSLDNGQREGYENELSADQVRLLNSMRIMVDASLKVRVIAGDETLLAIPFDERGMLYDVKEPGLTVLDEVLRKLSAQTIYIEEDLYLAAMQGVDFNRSIPIDGLVRQGLLVLSYSPGSRSFRIHVAMSCCDNNVLTFRRPVPGGS